MDNTVLDFEQQYLRVLKRLYDKLIIAQQIELVDRDRTGVGTVSEFGVGLKVPVSFDALPVLRTKFVHIKSVIIELIWMLSGSSNIRYLLENKVGIWTPNAYEYNKKRKGFPNIGIEDYTKFILSDPGFAATYGNLGGVYGAMWRNFKGYGVSGTGVDQIKNLLLNLKEKPESRQHMVLAWNPQQVHDVALPPCHFAFQVHVKGNKLSMTMYQRSADWFLGVPFNITSYAVLLLLIAQYSGYDPDTLYVQFGDAHLYSNHLNAAKVQLDRINMALPGLPKIRFDEIVFKNYLLDAQFEHFMFGGYDHLGRISADMAV